MNRIPDRKKQRREYLKKKGKAYAKVSRLTGLTLLFLFASALCSYCALVMLLEQKSIAFFIFAFFTIFYGLHALRKVRAAGAVIQNIRELPHVPPVAPDALPAEEVLVRGAEKPNATRETLLRVAGTNQDVPESELLRSSQEQQS